jgi:predicted transglutaminase-like cysteine proteinase
MKENNKPQLIVTNDTGGSKKLDKGITPANNGSPVNISRNQSQKLSGISQNINSSVDRAENSQSPGPQ